jgi:hypothetical protein
MFRRRFIFVTLAGCACARQDEVKIFPDAAAGGWTLEDEQETPASTTPEAVQRFGIRSGRRARYRGEGQLNVEVYEMSSDAAGLELEQTWRPSAGSVVFHRNRYFVIVSWTEAQRESVRQFIRELDQRLAGR